MGVKSAISIILSSGTAMILDERTPSISPVPAWTLRATPFYGERKSGSAYERGRRGRSGSGKRGRK